MKILTPFTVLLFILNTNALPYQPNNGIGRVDQDVDGIDFLIDQKDIESTIAQERSMPIPSGIPSERYIPVIIPSDTAEGKNLTSAQD